MNKNKTKKKKSLEKKMKFRTMMLHVQIWPGFVWSLEPECVTCDLAATTRFSWWAAAVRGQLGLHLGGFKGPNWLLPLSDSSEREVQMKFTTPCHNVPSSGWPAPSISFFICISGIVDHQKRRHITQQLFRPCLWACFYTWVLNEHFI